MRKLAWKEQAFERRFEGRQRPYRWRPDRKHSYATKGLMMGQAKQRGTYAQRKATALERKSGLDALKERVISASKRGAKVRTSTLIAAAMALATVPVHNA